MRLFFEIAYKGTNYHGWQVQKNAVTVQGVMHEALQTIFRKEIETIGSGRTDTGVHASQQYLHADLDKEIDFQKLRFKLNSLLPKDICIRSIRQVKSEASARFDAISRSYEYHIHQAKDPFLLETSYYFTKELNISLMNETSEILLGQHDFQCFSKVKTEVNNFICDIKRAEWVNEGNERLIFHISANRFLRGMVRAIVGTLLDIGTGKINLEDFEQIIASKDRKKAGRAAPAQGLFLTEIIYPDEIFL
ncbi:tRNA pseudouridine(38-40) synthase TruA [Fulvivirgaceae bacterium BMA10]|uniref:tRNA pseudouridine synthase A n=1 Tax=Splendidivirga corallicola TaxID=3051826 RepID=A0ABT8KSD4_9BACT|nr:tRNA pseudouridine(38-40) synthase TruA [Fulvivirgaceae bacterium BMA10]